MIAPSKARAQEIVGAGRTDFNGYWRLQKHGDASLQPETLYTRPMQPANNTATWQQGRCILSSGA